MRSSICLTFIRFRRCTKIHINIGSLRVHQSVRLSLCPFDSPNCLHILSMVSRSTARQPTQGVGSIRRGSSKIQKNYKIILNLQISTSSQTSSPSIFQPFTQPFLTRNFKQQASKYYKELLYSQKWKPEIQIFSFRSRMTLFCKQNRESTKGEFEVKNRIKT